MRKLGWLCVLVLVACDSGCARKNLAPVVGAVLLDDQPLPDARVSLVPPDGAGAPAQAMTDEAGRFTIVTHGEGNGAAPGEYRVVITKLEATRGQPAPTTDDQMQAMVKAQEEKAKHPLPAARSLVPVIYTDAARTPLRVTVPTEAPVTLRLSSAVRTPGS